MNTVSSSLSTHRSIGIATRQSYQDLSQVVKKELLDLGTTPGDVQKYFHRLKCEQPGRFQRLFFDENGHKPISKDLASILSDLKLAGVLPL